MPEFERVSLVDLGIHVGLFCLVRRPLADHQSAAAGICRSTPYPQRTGFLQAMVDEGRELRFSEGHVA